MKYSILLNAIALQNFDSSFRHKLIIQFILMISCILPLQAQTAKQICIQSSEKVNPENIEMVSILTIINAKNKKRVRKSITATQKFGTTSKMIMKFIEPAEVKGTGLLVYDHQNISDEMWIYMPALKKVRRIVSKEKSKRFMGSEFLNADMSKAKYDEFSYSYKQDEYIQKQEFYVIHAQCKDAKISKEYGYFSKNLWINKKTLLTHKVIFMDINGQMEREQFFSDYKKLENGKFLAFSMKISNLKNGRKSTISIQKVQSSQGLSELVFVPDQLKNW